MGNIFSTPDSLRVMVLGGSGVGKTSLVKRFISFGCAVSCKSSLFADVYHFRYKHSPFTKRLIEVIDISGDDLEDSSIKTLMMSASSFILLHSKDDIRSFEELELIQDKIQLVVNQTEVPVFVVANTSAVPDKVRRPGAGEAIRERSQIQAEYMEVSTFDGLGVKKLLTEVIEKSAKGGRA